MTEDDPVQSGGQPSDSTEPRQVMELKDLITGEIKDEPWQNKKYSADNALWQGAALRRRAHQRRTNVSLGVCAVDLSGPHEPTPRPGGQILKNPCHYFLALTVRPDDTAIKCEASTQTSAPDEPQPPEDHVGGPIPQKRPPALIYAALLGSKGDSPEAIKHLLAQINNDHANFPSEIIFRCHSDLGTEFMNAELASYCAKHGIHKTSTAGYDPNANSAETTVGTLKRRARYLLSGARLPTSWWGLAILASAQLCRADAGLEHHPRIAFGTRVMVVRDPKPRNAFLPRAEPATVFGPSSSVSGGMWTYQHGMVQCRANLAVQGLSDEDLAWVKVSLDNWDPPDGPLPLPDPQKYDAAALIPTRPVDGAATRLSASCPACIMVRRKRRITSPHTLVWGECLRAVAPPPHSAGTMPAVAVIEPIAEEDEEAQEELDATVAASTQHRCSPQQQQQRPQQPQIKTFNDTMLEHPHACLTLSEGATWGSAPQSELTDTDVPPSEDDAMTPGSDDDNLDFDDEWVVQGGHLSVISHLDETEPNQPEEQDTITPVAEELNSVSVEVSKDNGELEAEDIEFEAPRRTRKLTQRERRERRARAAAGHVDEDNKNVLQKVAGLETTKRLVSTKEVSASSQATQERWKLAAETEITNNFMQLGAFHESTKEEQEPHWRP